MVSSFFVCLGVSWVFGSVTTLLPARTADVALTARYIEFIKESVPKETALVVFRRYLMLEPDHVPAQARDVHARV